jgi:Archaeal holliday junction resolvase (hjc)
VSRGGPGRTGGGIPAEGRVRKRLEADGYIVMRAAGSKGPADLMAAKLGQLLLVQVKNCPWDSPGAHREEWWNPLWSAALQAGGIPVIADWAVPPGKVRPVLRYHRMTGPHTPGARDYPGLVVPFTTDEPGRPVPDAIVTIGAAIRRAAR